MSQLQRFARMTAVAACLTGSTVLADSQDGELPLPKWDRPQGFGLGYSLFPEGSATEDLPSVPAHSPAENATFTSEFPSAHPDHDLSLFLPDALLGKVLRPFQDARPTPPEKLRECSAPFLSACRSSPASCHLIDPDEHVTREQREDLSRFLRFHARDARVKAFVMVVAADEKLPDAASLAETASGALADGDACLAIYPMGEPWRARLFVNEKTGGLAGMAELNAMADDCARDAAQARDPFEQLHRFTVRLSIRLFWLERLMTPKQPMAESLPASSHEAAPYVGLGNPNALPTALDIRRHRQIDLASVIIGVTVSLAGGGATFAALIARRRRNRNRIWILPEIEIPQRLGGAFCGGGGAMIQYR